MNKTDVFFEQGLEFFKKGERNRLSMAYQTLLFIVDNLIVQLKNHEKGHEFYIQGAFDGNRSEFPEDATFKKFHDFFTKCQLAHLCHVTEPDILPTPQLSKKEEIEATKHAREEFYKLGKHAWDIMGGSVYSLFHHS